MKVLFGVTTGHSARPFFEGQFAYLNSRGHEVHLVCSREGGVDVFAEGERAIFWEVDAAREPSVVKDLQVLTAVIRLLRRESFDLAIWGSPKMGLLGTMASFFTQTKSVYVVHGLRYESASGLARRALMAFEALSIAMANRVVAVSRGVRDRLLVDRLARGRCPEVVGSGSANGVEIPDLGSSLTGSVAGDPSGRDGLRFVFVGRVTADKGVYDLVRAWSCINPLLLGGSSLRIVGARERDVGAEFDELLSRTHGVVELGYISDLSDLYRASDVLVLPSYREGLPTVVLEAASYGVPAIVSDATGCAESVIDCETGLVFSTGDIAALTESIEKLLMSPDLVKKFGLAARSRVEAEFARQKFHRQWVDYLEGL